MSTQVTIKGVVHAILAKQTFESGFEKQTLVVDQGGKYDNLVPIEFKKDKTVSLTILVPGDEVEVQCFLGGREYNGKHFLDLIGWQVEKVSGNERVAPVYNDIPPPAGPLFDPPSSVDDLPF